MPQVKLSKEDIKKIENVGIDLKEESRAGTFIWENDRDIYRNSKENVIIRPLATALNEFPWIKEILWSIVSPEKDDYTRKAFESGLRGSFIYIPPNTVLKNPVQTCFFIKIDRFNQYVHNIIYVGENSVAHMINGCTAASYVNQGLHAGITEFFIKKGATLSYTMIHDWAENMEVKPRSAALVEEDGTFISNYISLKKGRDVQMYPETILTGKNSTTRMTSLIYAPEGSHYDVGARVILKGENSKAEVISRTISDGGEVIARGHLKGENKNIKAHLECSGLMLKEKGRIHAIPELESSHNDVDLSHEAAVGKISREELEYLMARGLEYKEAVSAIVRGFMDIKIMGLPEVVEKQVERNLKLVEQAGL